VASDTKENDTEASDNEASDTKSSSKKDNSIVDILKDAVEEGTKTLPNIKDEVFKDNSSSNVVFQRPRQIQTLLFERQGNCTTYRLYVELSGGL
jgi:hypothetical protein